MIEIPGRIPITIHPIFWLFAALIGYLNSGQLIGVFVWVLIIFISVLIHEFGHALTAVFFGQSAKIALIALGGVTSYQGGKISFWKQFLIVLNGPLFGFFLFVFATLLLRAKGDWSEFPTIYFGLKITQIANLFWTVVNLLPIMPLDGGQLLRIVLEASFGVKGFKASLLIGAIVSTLIAVGFILLRSYLIGAIFFLFAFQSFASWKRSRFITTNDREEKNRDLLIKAETFLQEGKKSEAKALFEKVRSEAKKGLLATTASEYLAMLLADEGKGEEAYAILLPLKEEIADEIKPLLHKLAEKEKNYSLIAEFSAECYQLSPTQEVALRNARAFAFLEDPKPAGGWLMSAWQQGGLDLEHILKEEPFMKVKDTPEFKEFTDQMK